LLEKRGLKGCMMFDTNIMMAFTPRPKDQEQQEESNDEPMVSTA
jgi:hypothetical protein